MSPRQLLEKLDSLGIIDSKILDKIRREVENPDKTVKPKAVLSYLVKKNQITTQQAAQLLKAKPAKAKATKPVEEDIVVSQPVEQDYDTGDLTSIDEPEVPPKVDRSVTIVDDAQYVEPVEPEIEVSQVYDPADLGVDEVATPVAAAPAQGFGQADALGGDEYSSGAYPTQDAPAKTATFKGKRDQSDQWGTRWLYIGFGLLGAILIGVAITYIANSGQKPEDMFEAANESYKNSSFVDAAEKFQNFLDEFPTHERAPRAKVLWTNAVIRNTFNTKNYKETITQTDTLVSELVNDENADYDLTALRDDLAIMLPQSLLDITETGVKKTELPEMESALAEITKLKAVVDNPIYIPPSIPKRLVSVADNLGKIENNKRTIEGKIKKEQDYNTDLIKIREFADGGQTDQAFAVYQKLLRNYGDLASRAPLRDLMLEVSAKEADLVSAIETNLAVSNMARTSPIQASVVLAAKNGEAVESLREEVLTFLADGSVYGIDAGDGSIVWRKFVGFQATVEPIKIDAELTAVVDEVHNDLLGVDHKTGDIRWRVEFTEPLLAPSVGDKSLIVTTRGGKVFQLNSASGAIERAVNLPQSEANVGALIAEREPLIYQPGYYSNLYILSKQDLSCAGVYYLGHYKGSIAAPPVAWQNYILVAINGGDYCDLHVLRPSEDGVGLEPVQILGRVTNGPVSTPMARAGRWIMVSADNGEVQMLELITTDDQNPIRKFVSGSAESDGTQQNFTFAEGTNVWLAGDGITRNRVPRNGQLRMSVEISAEQQDIYVSDVQKIDDYLFTVRRRNQSGMLSASMSDAKSLKEIWRTDFAGRNTGSPQQFGDRIVVVNNQGDMFSIDSEALADGASDSPVRSSTLVENLQFEHQLRLDQDRFVCVGPDGRRDLLYCDGAKGASKLLVLGPPADKPTARPIVVQDNLVIPSASGAVAMLDPANVRMTKTPFVPEVKINSYTNWFEPTMVSQTLMAIASGESDNGTDSTLYLMDTSDSSKLQPVGSVVGGAPFSSRVVSDGSSVFVVMETGDADKLAAFNTSAPIAQQAEVELDGSLVSGPWMTEAGILVQLDNDQIYCFGNDLSQKWKMSVGNDALASEPFEFNGGLMLVLQSGVVAQINPATGETAGTFALGQPVIHRPLQVGSKLYFSSSNGIVHVVDLNSMTSNLP